ncbi:hypothetical protein LAZ67_7000435 [Cordylochernes scorpioides]|uniref:Reverse transcriptase domain-containing protein n=1 Tax=Cordylochernes scorpioides TaxID=51811 RepID=A0ABY6KPN8_9ARAC|nr:hypothetical protein LAZ67_7000435 [Cordylochernes scorpioides]
MLTVHQWAGERLQFSSDKMKDRCKVKTSHKTFKESEWFGFIILNGRKDFLLNFSINGKDPTRSQSSSMMLSIGFTDNPDKKRKTTDLPISSDCAIALCWRLSDWLTSRDCSGKIYSGIYRDEKLMPGRRKIREVEERSYVVCSKQAADSREDKGKADRPLVKTELGLPSWWQQELVVVSCAKKLFSIGFIFSALPLESDQYLSSRVDSPQEAIIDGAPILQAAANNSLLVRRKSNGHTLLRPYVKITNLANICLSMGTFTYNYQFYRQIRGSPMGSPLSTIAAEIVMTRLDTWIIQRHLSDILIWRRYVDFIFCICKNSQENLIQSDLNSYHPDLSFSIEKEHSQAIPFLDILILRTPNAFHTTVYYKKKSPLLHPL